MRMKSFCLEVKIYYLVENRIQKVFCRVEKTLQNIVFIEHVSYSATSTTTGVDSQIPCLVQ